MKINYLIVLIWVFSLFTISGCVSNQPVKQFKANNNQTKLSQTKKAKQKKRDPNRNSIDPVKKNNVLVTNLESDDDNHHIGTNVKSQLELKCTVKMQCAKLIQSKIINLWEYARSYPKRKTVLVLDLTKDGQVSTIKMKRSSGLRGFDDSVIKAVLKAEPFTEITYLSPSDNVEFSSIELVFKR